MFSPVLGVGNGCWTCERIQDWAEWVGSSFCTLEPCGQWYSREFDAACQVSWLIAKPLALQFDLLRCQGQLWLAPPQHLRQFSMGRFITHDPIERGIFNRDTCTATAAMTSWQSQLLNSPVLLDLLCQRLENDYKHTPMKFRKPWNFQQIVS